jgi:hypothetical protein
MHELQTRGDKCPARTKLNDPPFEHPFLNANLHRIREMNPRRQKAYYTRP